MESSTDPVLARLSTLQPLSGKILRQALAWSPWVCAFLLLADWLVGRGAFTRDILRFTASVAAVLELALFQHLFSRLADRLSEFTQQGTLAGEPEQTAFLRWLERLEHDLNHPLAWTVAGLLGAACLALTYPVLYFFQTGAPAFTPQDTLVYYTWGNAGLVAPLVGLFLGLLVWRAGALAFNLYRLGRDVDLRVLPEHPDRCGGLRILGDLCLQLALVVLIPAIYLAFWGIAYNLVPLDAIRDGATLYADTARRGLLFLVAAAFFLFLMPVNAIHRRMLRRRAEVQRELAELSASMDQIAAELRDQADRITPAQGKERLERLDFMDKVFQRSKRFPTWPFDARLLAGFASAQVLPLLSLLGAGEPITKALLILFGWFQ